MGSSVELRLGSDNNAETVLCRGPRSVELFGGDGMGSDGVSGGERIEVSGSFPPYTHDSRSTAWRGSATSPHLISPSPKFDMCMISPFFSVAVAPCVVVPRIKYGRVAGSGHI